MFLLFLCLILALLANYSMPLVYYQIRSNLLHFCYVYSVPAHVCEDSCLYPTNRTSVACNVFTA